MLNAELQRVVQELASHPAITVVLTGQMRDGDRVSVSLGDVTATGVIASRSLYWSTLNGVNNLPVILDGTGQMVKVHASAVTLI